MIIAVACDVLGAENNGTTIASMNLIRFLKSKGHTVRVICCDEAHRGEEGYYICPSVTMIGLKQLFDKNNVVIAKADKDLIRQALTGVDIVHIMFPFSIGQNTAKIAHEMGLPITAGFHCQAENVTNQARVMNSKFANNLTYKIFWKHMYQYCNAIHYPTKFIQEQFEKVVGKPTPAKVISNGVNSIFVPKEVEKPKSLEERFVILFTGRFSREKSHKLLMEGVAGSKYKDQIQLIFAGCGGEDKNFVKFAKKKGINMPIMKFFTRAKLVDIINYSDLYVHPAEIEIEAIACLEAISCGKVPVISDSPRSATNKFALHDTNLFDHKNPQSLSQKIDYWIEHPKERKECSEEYQGFAKDFAFDACMDMMEDMLYEIAGIER